MKLERYDVRGLRTLRPLFDFELDGLAVVQRSIPIGYDGGEVDDNIFSILALNESEAFSGVKPLHCSLFFQFFSLF